MLSKDILSSVLARCLITGGDFAEIFEEDTLDTSISILNGKVENSISGRTHGIGIRIFKGYKLSLIHISEPTRPGNTSRMPSSA